MRCARIQLVAAVRGVCLSSETFYECFYVLYNTRSVTDPGIRLSIGRLGVFQAALVLFTGHQNHSQLPRFLECENWSYLSNVTQIPAGSE